MTSEDFDLISVAYRSRFFFRTDAAFRRALGVSFETILNNRDSAREMRACRDILNRKSMAGMDRTAEDVLATYLTASDFYLSLDWGDRAQLASRKRFCRMLFRLFTSGVRKLSIEEEEKFRMKDDDSRLLGEFFPEGTAGKPACDIAFILLFAFGVLRPWSGETARSRDIPDKEVRSGLEKLRSLIDLLREDQPRLGLLEKPLCFSQYAQIIEERLAEPDGVEDISPLSLYAILFDISQACRALQTAEDNRLRNADLQGIDLRGIWVDDTDEGRERFWIFPDNFFYAFCYSRNGMGWKLNTFEFRVRFPDNPDWDESFVLVPNEANFRWLLNPDRPMEDKMFGDGFISAEADPESGELTRVKLTIGNEGVREWLDWTCWMRLLPGDERLEEFREAIRSVYDPADAQSVIFRNVCPEASDLSNCIVGRDNRYVYIHDQAVGRFVMKERRDGRFEYVAMEGNDGGGKALFELEVTEKHPLYAIPLKMNGEACRELGVEKLAEVMEEGEYLTEAYILHPARGRWPRLLLPNYGYSVELDMERLAATGIRKFTSRPF